MVNDIDSIKWKGEEAFYIVGTDRSEDTIQIEGDSWKEDYYMSLVLPTLCITYADMKFANDIGGMQREYPESKIYGSKYFDPAVVIEGAKEIEKLTWIRGAKRITIGPKETIIEWRKSRTLVIPRLRIKAKEKALAKIRTPEITIFMSQPFSAKIMQYADGRHIGGMQLIKRHPKWKPQPAPETYDLWIRIIDGDTRRGISKATVRLFSCDTKEKTERFVLESEWYTDKIGTVNVSTLPCSDKKLLLIECESYLPQIWRFRPLSGQKVKLSFKLWKGQQIPCKETQLPCYEAIYRVQTRDTIMRVTHWFCYNSTEELAAANKLTKPYKLFQDQELHLPGWCFIQVRTDNLFIDLDKKMGIPPGWARPAQRILHDDPTCTYEKEVVAVPTQKFVQFHKLKKWF